MADIPRVLELWTHNTAEGVSNNAESIRVRLRRDRHLFLLAWDGTRLVGSAIGGWDGWRAGMYRLAVDAAYRRRGVARMLVRAIEKELRRLGAKRISALVASGNHAGRGFWNAAGYTLDDQVVRYVKNLR
jgi:ribosomal protein S18 acetylase RimI-like enzyme